MMLSSLFDEVQERFPGYVFELRQILMLHNLPLGRKDSLQFVAGSIKKSRDLQQSVAHILRAMIRREREQISSIELLAVFMQAAGCPAAQHADVREEAAIEEILGFIFEIRHPHQNSAASTRPTPLQREIDAHETNVNRSASLVKPNPEVHFTGSVFGDDAAETSAWNRSVMVVAVACSLVLGIAITVALHQHGPTQRSFANEMSSDNIATSTSDRSGPAARTPSIFRHRGSFTTGNSSHGHGTTSPRVATDPNNAGAASAPPLTHESVTSRSDVPRLVQAVQPVHLGTSGLQETELPSPTQSASTTSINRASTPVDLRPSVVSHGRPALHTGSPGYVHAASAGIMAANVVSSPSPAYPSAASSAGVQGEVTVRALVGRDGNVMDARVVSGPPLLRDAALQAVEQWQYRPYLVDGKPSVIATTAIVDFKLPTP